MQESEATSNTEQTTQSEPETDFQDSPLKRLRLERVHSFNIFPRELFSDGADDFLTEETIDRLFEIGEDLLMDPHQIVLCFYDPEGQPVGILWLSRDAIHSALVITYLAVLPEYRGRRFMKLCTGITHQLAKSYGMELMLGSTSRMSQLWEDLGWKLSNTRIIYQEV